MASEHLTNDVAIEQNRNERRKQFREETTNGEVIQTQMNFVEILLPSGRSRRRQLAKAHGDILGLVASREVAS